MSLLTAAQASFWEDQGYLVLSSFFKSQEVEAVNSLIENRVANPSSFKKATIDVLHGRLISQRLRVAEAPSETFQDR